jgi:pyridoxal phosphate enzyme (YggS family)
VSLTAAEPGPDDHGRRAGLAARLAALRSRIGAACAEAGRDPDEITLVAVTKTYPAADVLAWASLGLTDFGENRDQEAAPKAAAVAQAGQRVTWHFIGQLQSNKAHSVAQYARYVHSVDRPRLVRHLGAAAASVPGRNLVGDASLGCLIQVSLDGDTSRGGAPADQLLPLAEQIHREPGLALGGLMAVAPRDADPRAAFAPLRRLSDLIRSVSPSAGMISAGMSGDLEAAIANGATHLRIGTALLGNRTLPVR